MHKIVRTIYVVTAGVVLGIGFAIAGVVFGMFLIEKTLKAFGN